MIGTICEDKEKVTTIPLVVTFNDGTEYVYSPSDDLTPKEFSDISLFLINALMMGKQIDVEYYLTENGLLRHFREL